MRPLHVPQDLRLERFRTLELPLLANPAQKLDANPRRRGFLQRVQKEPAYQSIPVIIISTEGKEEDTIRGLKMGAKGYVKKPFQASELHGLIEKITTTA